MLCTPAGAGKHDRVENRLSGQEFLIEQCTTLGRFVFVVQGDPGEDLGRMPYKVREIIVMQDDKVLPESLWCKAVLITKRATGNPLGHAIRITCTRELEFL